MKTNKFLGRAAAIGIVGGLGALFNQSLENQRQYALENQENFDAASSSISAGATASNPILDDSAACAFDEATGLGLVAKDGAPMDITNIVAIKDGMCVYGVNQGDKKTYFTTFLEDSPNAALNFSRSPG